MLIHFIPGRPALLGSNSLSMVSSTFARNDASPHGRPVLVFSYTVSRASSFFKRRDMMWIAGQYDHPLLCVP